MSLLIFGQVTGDVPAAEAAPVRYSVPAAASAALSSFGTITGSVSFAPAPDWDEQSADQSFTVALIDGSRNRVDSSFVSMSYGDTGSSAFSISYFNAYPYIHHFDYGDSYTIAIYPTDPVYQTTYLGGSSSPQGATYVRLPPPGTGPVVGVGNTGVALTATISGILDVPGGLPAGGVQAVAVSAEPDGYRSFIRFADVRPDGSYHILGLIAAGYNVAFVPTGTMGQPGAGIWWKSKTSLTGASVVTLEQSQQKVGVNQTLPAGGVITGVVRDSQGLLVHGGSEVSIYSAVGPTDSRLTVVQRVRSDEDGTYQFWGLPLGRYKVGFTTVAPPIAPTSLRLRSLDGTPLPTRTTPAGTLPAVDIEEIYGGNGDGELPTSSYPYTSAWYKSPAATFTSAKSVVIKSAGQIVPNINGILPVSASFSGWQTDERTGGQNPSQKPGTCACLDPVDTFSGEFSESTVDLALPGTGPRVQVDRTYSAALADTDGPFGWGSASSFSAKLVVVPRADNPEPQPGVNLLGGAIVTQENGATVTFTLTPQNDYIAPARVNATLNYESWLDEWVFTRNATDVLRFNDAGAVLSHSDLHGNTVDYGTDGSGVITSISGTGDRSIALTWADGHISSATDSAGRTVSYTYNALGELTSVTAVDGRVLGFGYDSAHHVTTKTAPDGGVVTNVYDDQARVVTQTDALGRVSVIAYEGTSEDLTTTVTNPAGVPSAFHYVNGVMESRTSAVGTKLARVTRYVYDAALNVVKQTDPLRKSSTMTYDIAGNMLTLTDPLGHTSGFTYDGLHNVTSVTDALGRVSTAVYDEFGQKTSASLPSGATSTWEFNADGTVATSTDPLGQTTSYGYDSAGRLTSTTDPLNRVGQIGYDAAGHAVSHTDPSGAITTLAVDPAGRTLSTTDPLGRVTGYGYDSAGSPTSLTAPDGTVTTTVYNLGNELVSRTDALGHTTTATYTALGDIETTTNANGAVTTTNYNLLGVPISVVAPQNLKTTTGYDKAGRATVERTPAGHVSRVSYDAAGRKITSTDPLGNVSTYSYDDANQLIAVTDPLGRATQMSYDVDGRLTTVTGPDGQVETTAYDASGRKVGYTDADGNVTTFVYDAVGQLISQTAPGGLVTGYAYDSAGRVELLTKPDGTVISNTYDAAGQLLESSPSAGVGVSLTYDALGRRATMTDATGTSEYEYSLTGQPTKVTNGAALSVGYSYDPAGLNTQMVYPDGKTVDYVYDLAGRMTSLMDWANHKISFAWTKDSMLAKQTDPNKVVSTTVYNKNNQISSIAVVNKKSPATTLASYQYGYDAGSQLTSTAITDPLHTDAGGVATSYGYDQRGQLTASGTEGSFRTTAAGQLTATPSGSTLNYNAAQQLTSLVSASAEVTTDFQYDGNGSRAQSVTSNQSVTGPVTTLSYDYRNNLSSVTSVASGVSYTTNGDGLRQSRTSGAVTDQFVWDTTASIPLLLTDGPSLYIYGPALTPVAQVDTAGVIQYLHTDNIGSVRLITNSAREVVGASDYTPYGAVTAHAGTSVSNFGFATAWADPDTKMNYLRAREYDPATGQFLQVDPAVISTHQPYAYVAGDPLASIDPTGLCKESGILSHPGQCTPDDYFWPSLPETIYTSICGTVDGWTCAVQKLDPVYWLIAGIDACSRASDVWGCTVQTFNPVYKVIDGYSREIRDTQNGCDWTVIAQDGLDAVSGVANTVALAGGAVRAGPAVGKTEFGAPRALTASEQRSVNSLQAQVDSHVAKLDAYRANPFASDNLGILRNARTPEIAQRIIDGRINHLKTEIGTFQTQIDKILGAG